MPIFYYEGRDNKRRIRTGKRIVESAELLSSQLMKEGITPITIRPLEEKPNMWANFRKKLFERKVSLDDLSLFSRQMYTLTKTGVPIANAIKHLADGMSNRTMAAALYGMVEHLEAGEDIARSMEYYPRIFPPIVTNMVRVGQSSGRLSEAFLRINQYLSLESSTIKDLKTALRYPVLVLLTTVGAVVLINIFVVPAFTGIFANTKMELPLPTRILISMSDIIRNHYILLIMCVVAFIAAIMMYIRTTRGKLQWHTFLYRMPIVGKMVRGTILLRFSQTFAMTLDSGIPLIESIELVAESINNEFAKQRILSMREAIEHGNSLTKAASRTHLFNSLELQMLSVSEETGEISAMLNQIADHYKVEVDYNLKRLSSLIEPILIFSMAGIVLLLALAVYLPIWNMTQLANKG